MPVICFGDLQDVVEGDNLGVILEELKAILISPMKASHQEDKERDETDPQEDIPAQFIKVMGKGMQFFVYLYFFL